MLRKTSHVNYTKVRHYCLRFIENSDINLMKKYVIFVVLLYFSLIGQCYSLVGKLWRNNFRGVTIIIKVWIELLVLQQDKHRIHAIQGIVDETYKTKLGSCKLLTLK